MKSIILLGNGGHCKSCIDVIENSDEFSVKGVISKNSHNQGTFMDYEILGNDDNIPDFFNKDDYGLVAIGQIKSAKRRVLLFNILTKYNINLAIVKSKYSLVSRSAKLGKGTIAMHNSLINSGANIGINCILNTNSIIEHDVKIGNHCHISTGAIINGGVTIGSESFLGSGCIVREGVNIGNNVLVSAGKVVMSDIASNTIYK